MSSMLSKNHIKMQDLAPYLRGYDSKSPETAEEWAKGQSAGFEPGMLIFCLEKVAAAPGLAVGRRDEGGDSYRVRDLCIVVGEDGGRPLVVNITASAYELRFLEVLMFEKAKKAILDEKDFSFAAARPAQKIDQAKIEEIEQLGAVYAQGGSRRSLVVDVTGPQEPAMALLSSLGVKLSMTGIGKQAIDIGYICLLLYTPDGRTEDKNKAQVKSAFFPIPITEKLGTSSTPAAASASSPAASAQPTAANVWQPPLPPGAVQVPPGSETLLSGGQQSVHVSDEEPDDLGWQPPAAPVPDFAFAPSQPPAFAAGDFQEELAHKTEFEQHLGQPDASASNWATAATPTAADWNSPPPAPVQEWGSPAPNQAGEWAPAPTSPDWGAPASAGAGDWGSPPAQTPGAVPESSDWSSPATAQPTAPSGDWGSGPTSIPTPSTPASPATLDWGAPPNPGSDWNTPQTKTPDLLSSGDWGAAPVQTPITPAASGPVDWGSPGASTPQAVAPTGTLEESPTQVQTASGSWVQAAPGTTPGTGAWNTPWAQSGPEPTTPEAAAAAPTGAPEAPEAAEAQAPEGAAIPKKDANLFNRLYQQLAKGSPGSSMTNLPPVTPESALSPESSKNPNASQTNLPRLSQELLSRTSAPQSPSASATNLQPMDPELAAHFRIPTPPPEAAQEEEVEPVTPKAQPAPSPTSFDWTSAAEPASSDVEQTEGNEAPSWLESLDKKKAAPSTAPNLKLPKQTPSTSSSSLPAARGPEFEMPAEFNLPLDPDNLRETGKIKMTPSMRDAVKRKAMGEPLKAPEPPAPVEVETTGTQSAPEAVVSPEVPDAAAETQPVSPVEPVEEQPQFKHPANISFAPQSVEEATEAALPTLPTMSTEEDPYKHLAEALSGLMSIDDDEPETTASTAAPAAPTAPATPVTGPATSVSSRFAAMEAAFTPSEESPFKPLSISQTVPALQDSDLVDEPAAGDTTDEQAKSSAESTGDLIDPLPPNASLESQDSEPTKQTAPDFLVTSRTGIPAVTNEEVSEPVHSTPADVLDANLMTSAPNIPILAEAQAPHTVAASSEETAAAEVKPAAAKPAPFQEPRLVMNEMVTLMNKLEQQVAKAAKKISSRSEDIKQRLNKQVDDLLQAASQVENQNHVVVQDTTAKLSKSLDSSTDDARQNISEIAADGRYKIKQLLTSNQQAVDDTKNKLLEDLTKACDEFRQESDALGQECETFLGQFVKDKTDLIEATLKEISGRLDETNTSFLTKINGRFERFKERMNDEASSIGRSLERNVHSMFEEIDGSWDRASEKLKLTKSEFEQTILHSVKTVELSASQNTRQILISSMAPQLRERTRRLLDLKDGLTKQFMSDTVAQSSLQLQGLESSLAAARQQLHTLVNDCVSNLDGVGRGQQAGLEEIFKTASSKTEKLTSEVQLAIQDAQTRVQENELICKRLAENSSVDTDPELTEERNGTTSAIQKLKSQCNSQIQTSLEDACTRLEQMSQKVQNESTTHRMQLTQGGRDASENGLNRIREAVQEAFAAVQAAREQYME